MKIKQQQQQPPQKYIYTAFALKIGFFFFGKLIVGYKPTIKEEIEDFKILKS